VLSLWTYFTGADKTAKNNNGKTAYALATADARNPLSQNEKVLEMLKH